MASVAYKDSAGAIQEIRFDAVVATEINIATQITEHPVEEGAPVTDHVRTLPPLCTITAYVSNTPLPSNPDAQRLFETREFDLPQVSEKVAQTGEFELPPPPFRQSGMVSVFRSAQGAVENVLGLAETGPKKMFGVVGAIEQAGGAKKMHGAVGVADADTNRAAAIFKKLEELQLAGTLVTYVDSIRQYEDVVIENLSAARALEDGKGASFDLSLKRIRIVSSQRVTAPLPAEVRGLLSASKGAQSTGDDKNKQLKSFAVAELQSAGVIQ